MYWNKFKGPLNQRIINIFLLRRKKFQRLTRYIYSKKYYSHVLISTNDQGVSISRETICNVKSKAFSDVPDINKAKAFIADYGKDYI